MYEGSYFSAFGALTRLVFVRVGLVGLEGGLRTNGLGGRGESDGGGEEGEYEGGAWDVHVEGGYLGGREVK